MHDRIVITMSENDTASFRGAIIHMAISKAGAVPDDFTSTYWHLYTGDGTISGTAGAAFVLDQDPMTFPQGLEGIADHPTVAIDADYVYLCIRDSFLGTVPFDLKQQAVAIPIVHSGGNLYSGNRVAETEMSFINFRTIALPLRPIEDRSDLHGSVMETTPFAGVLVETAPPSGGSPATFDYPTPPTRARQAGLRASSAPG